MIESKEQNELTLQDEFTEQQKAFFDYLKETGQFTEDELDTELITLFVGVSKELVRFIYEQSLFVVFNQGTDTGVTIESFALVMLGIYKEVQVIDTQ